MSQDPEKRVSVQDEPETKVHVEPDAAASSSEKTSLEQSTPNDAPKAPYNPWMDPAAFPDGGPRAWLTVAAAAACFFVSWGYVFPTPNCFVEASH